MQGTKSDTHTQQQEKLKFCTFTLKITRFLEDNVHSHYLILSYHPFMITIATCYCSSERFIPYLKDLLAIFMLRVYSMFW
jgi:hypothetical protein